MHRPWQIAAVFGVCLAVVLAAMGWLSIQVLRLDRADAEARRQAGREENVRLALWRMESALSPVVAQESTQPYFAYTSFYPVDRAYTRMYNKFTQGEILLPSPLLVQGSPYVIVHFQFGPRGDLTSPEVPTGSMWSLAESGYTSRRTIEEAASRLAKLKVLVNPPALAAALPHDDSALPSPAIARVNEGNINANTNANNDLLAITAGAQAQPQAQGLPQRAGQAQPQAAGQDSYGNQSAAFNNGPQQFVSANNPAAQQGANASLSPQAEQQLQRNVKEYAARSQNLSQNRSNTIIGLNQQMVGNNSLALSDVRQGAMRPLWFGDCLVLARRVTVGGEDYIQGAWLDWPALRGWLLAGARDLVPEADLVPVADPAADEGGRMLAAIPARLVPGRVAEEPEVGLSPVAMTLGIAWACTLLAVVAVGVLLLGTVALSERRGAFVSAVTHELRTPLTTFRMYSEMLAGGMVTDDDKRRRYLVTLRTEAERLTHLVENVLAYARLERGRARGRVETVRLADLVTRTSDRLADRASQAGMELVVEMTPDEGDAAVRADASVVEQILFNLVDNACKYAASASDKRIHLVACREGGRVALKVCDHGPGIAPAAARRLFRPFSKSAAEAAVSAPGVGLGLALSRRLARDMGGDLAYEGRGAQGACFVLALRGESA